MHTLAARALCLSRSAVAAALGHATFAELLRELRLIAADCRRWPTFEVSHAGYGGMVRGSLGPFRFVFYPHGLAPDSLVHPRSLFLAFGPWRSVTVRVGPYRVFTRDSDDTWRYVSAWRFAALPADFRARVGMDWLTRRDLGLFPMLGRISAADLGPFESLEELEDREHDDDLGEWDESEWDERFSALIDSWDEVYA